LYLYEMHCHALPCSACGGIQPEDLVRGMKEIGYSGMVLTDHFYHGNTGIRRNMPWEDFVAAYEESFLRAKAIGDQLDFDVLFGIEEGIGDCKEALIYGLTPQFFYDHPEMRDCDLPYLSRIVREAGDSSYRPTLSACGIISPVRGSRWTPLCLTGRKSTMPATRRWTICGR